MNRAGLRAENPDEPDPAPAALIEDARRRLLDLERKVVEQVEQYIDGSVAEDTRPSAKETDEERVIREAMAVKKTARRKVDAKRCSGVLGLFSSSLRELIAHGDSLGDDAARSSLMVNLMLLLEASNTAGGLAGDLANETKQRSITDARRVNSLRPVARLEELYKDVEPILHEKDQNRTAGAIFRKLHQTNRAKYPESKRRTTVRDIDDLLERLIVPRRQQEIDSMWAKLGGEAAERDARTQRPKR